MVTTNIIITTTPICCVNDKFHYLCIKVGTRLCETLQNGAEIRWSNSGRLRLEHFFNANI